MKVIFKCKDRIYHYYNLDVMLKCEFLCLVSYYINVDLRILFGFFFQVSSYNINLFTRFVIIM
jgi:hypothetical protein